MSAQAAAPEEPNGKSDSRASDGPREESVLPGGGPPPGWKVPSGWKSSPQITPSNKMGRSTKGAGFASGVLLSFCSLCSVVRPDGGPAPE